MPLVLPALYPIVNVGMDDAEEQEAKLRLARELADAGARLVQLRAKTMATGAFARLAERLVTDLSASDCLLIINDRADVAASIGATGVHLGDTDIPPQAARKLLSDDAVLGLSTHSATEAAAVDPALVDYIGFGPVYDSPTKAGVRDARGVGALRSAVEVSTLPVVAIGGVTSEFAEQVFAAGAASCAVVSEIERVRHASGFAALLQTYERYRTEAAERG
jgi:thiamine-phosphate pyrophosphorylase